MYRKSLSSWLNAIPIPSVRTTLFCCALAFAGSGTAQVTIIADNLTPFQPRDVGTTSDAKTVRITLNRPLAISSIAVAPGFTEFTAGAPSTCVVDGHTINPALSICIVDVTFSPQHPGLRTAPLEVTDGTGKKYSLGLEGTGLAPRAALTPGIITTIAGNGTYGFSGDGGPAINAVFNFPNCLTLDQQGNVYFCDLRNNRIRKIDLNGIITTIAGNGGTTYSGDGRPATSTGLGYLSGLTFDAAGNMYISDEYNGVFKVDRNGIITTFATHLGCPVGITVDVAQNVYIADPCRAVVLKVDPKNFFSIFAGNGTETGPLGDGGPATEATVFGGWDVAADIAGNVYIAENYGNRIRKVDLNGIITTYAGTGTAGFSGDGGPATQAEFNEPEGIAVDAAGNVYVYDNANFRIRRIDKHGTIKTIAGMGSFQYSGDGGPATKAGFTSFTFGLDSSGAFFMPDYNNNRIRKVDVSKSAVIFASQSVGTVSPSQEAIVTNNGNQHMEFTSLSFTGDFAQLTGTARDCTDTTFLGAGFSCALRITFNPSAAGARSGSLTVTDNSLSLPGTKQTISLSGTGANP